MCAHVPAPTDFAVDTNAATSSNPQLSPATNTDIPDPMADVRALLKAKRQEARVSHPYAAYSAAGQLRCSVCGMAVKHAAAWEGHLGSKAHRTSVARMREEEEKEKVQQEAEEEEADEGSGTPATAKRKASTPPAAQADEKKRRVEEAAESGFPADFFSDPSRAPVLLSDDEDEDKYQPAPPADTAVESEYARFQRELLALGADATETYARATVAAEPVLAESGIEGFPAAATEAEAEVEVSEAEQRVRREQEERELIMDRLLEEERAQEEADTRVQVLKAKLDALRRKREAKKAVVT